MWGSWVGLGCSGPPGRAAVSPPELSNVEFHCGRAEDLVPPLVSRLASQQLVAILDPPRAGLREWSPPGAMWAGRGWHTRLCGLWPPPPPPGGALGDCALRGLCLPRFQGDPGCPQS